MAELLIELFSEEIPARMQAGARRDLERMVTSGMKEAGLTHGDVRSCSTPRRLTLVIDDVPASTPDISEERRGPRVDAPEKAVEGFIRGAGVTRDQLVEREEKKGTFFFVSIEQKGRDACDVVADVVAATVANFPWPKSQRWGESSLKWVRPLHSIICLLGGEAIDVGIDGVSSGNKTQGHRFMAPDAITVKDFADYQQQLRAAKVITDHKERADMIASAAKTLAKGEGLEWVEDQGLLTEVAALVEWPVPLMGSFDPAFMAVPEEVLILTMKKDQKYFVCRDTKSGKLAPNFITVSNIDASDGGAVVAAGNEKVLSARLADAKFFWEQDLKTELDDLNPQLADIVFHIELGTVAERVERMKALGERLAPAVGCDAKDAIRAAELSKADLVSNMVYEFPEVQGVMGRYYALEQGEDAAVADAIRDHYAPKGPDDACPTAPVSVAVALAEKIDTLVGFFSIGQKPTGSKDPFALRRAALGVIRLITENGVRLKLSDLIKLSIDTFTKSGNLRIAESASSSVEDGTNAELIERSYNQEHLNLLPFFADRLKVQQRDKGVRHDIIDAAGSVDDMTLLLSKVSALSAFLATDDGANLLAGYKRAANILRIEEKKDSKSYSGDVDESLLSDTAEKELFAALTSVNASSADLLDKEAFEDVMGLLSSLRGPIDKFFDDVTVNADDVNVRANRLCLLAAIRASVDNIAEFAKIEG